MRESARHSRLKALARDMLEDQGYSTKSLDAVEVDGYGIPDLIVESDEEVLFVEVVVTNDGDKKPPETYDGKPVRLLKYVSLEPHRAKTSINIDQTLWTEFRKLALEKETTCGRYMDELILRELQENSVIPERVEIGEFEVEEVSA